MMDHPISKQTQEKLDYMKWLITTGVVFFGSGPVEKELLGTSQELANIIRKELSR